MQLDPSLGTIMSLVRGLLLKPKAEVRLLPLPDLQARPKSLTSGQLVHGGQIHQRVNSSGAI